MKPMSLLILMPALLVQTRPLSASELDTAPGGSERGYGWREVEISGNVPAGLTLQPAYSSNRPRYFRMGLGNRPGAGVAGALMPVMSKVNAGPVIPPATLIRPPGAVDGPDFLSLCVRCGECMKVCIQNALQPCFMESGYEGMFTPRLIPRVGYCEFNCTLCGQVCPTGAIRKLTVPEKHRTVIGIAVFDKDRCLPFAKDIPCIVCEEHCPTHDKAIKFREVTVTNVNGESVPLMQPYVIDDLCIGCGICENKCPLPGEGAIRVVTHVITQGEADDGYSGY